MWRRLASQLRPIAASRSASTSGAAPLVHPAIAVASPFHASLPALSFSSLASGEIKKSVEDVMPIATGLEREEIEAELKGLKRFDMDAPVGPFGTKEAPAVIKSYYNKRLIGCPGGEGEDEHDVVWFWLEKGKPHECPVCTQYFTSRSTKRPPGFPVGTAPVGCLASNTGAVHNDNTALLDVIGNGGDPDGHSDDEHEH